MARRTARRTEWRRTKTGTWTRSLGERGCRVRLFQKRTDGMFYRGVHLRGAGRDQAPLGTRDREVAESLGRQLLAALLSSHTAAPRPAGPVRLGELWERYRLECASHLDNKAHTRHDAEGRAQVLLGFFRPGRDVRTLSAADVARYAQTRRAGGIPLPD